MSRWPAADGPLKRARSSDGRRHPVPGFSVGPAHWTAFLAFCLLVPGLSGCSAEAGPNSGADTLTIGAYSVVREAFHKAVLPAFARRWKESTGRTVRFEEAYNASGAQSRAIASGFDADVAVLSLEGDVSRLVKAGLVKETWNKGPDRGMISRSLVVVGVREGNPRGVKDWDDLTRDGVDVLYPDPKTSGGARWNINAIYGAGLLKGKPAGAKKGTFTDEQKKAGRDLLSRVQSRVVNMDASGRQSMATFERGTGDAIVTYENELLLQRKLTGKDAPYVIPPSTLLIEGPAAVVDASVARHGNRELAEAFLKFLRSEECQKILVEYGFRPLDPKIDDPARPTLPPKTFTMADLGGWSKVTKEVYDPGGVWDALFTSRSGR
jgi:sulfate/thiosulfate transport system substrate-binding protein